MRLRLTLCLALCFPLCLWAATLGVPSIYTVNAYVTTLTNTPRTVTFDDGGGGGSTINFRSVATGTSDTPTISATKPANTADNDFLVAIMEADNAGSTWTAQTGWTNIGYFWSAVDNGTMAVFYHIAASDGATYYFTNSDSASKALTVVCYSNATAIAFDSVSTNTDNVGTASPDTIVGNSVTTSVANCRVIWIVGADIQADINSTFTEPSGLSLRSDHYYAWNNLAIADVLQASAGASGAKYGTNTWTGGGNEGYGCWVMSIKP